MDLFGHRDDGSAPRWQLSCFYLLLRQVRTRAWSGMSQAARTATLRDAREWEVMMTNGELFPKIDPAAVRKLRVPVLLMSGGASYEFIQYIDQELVRLIRNAESIVYPDAGHQMWLKYPRLCRDDAMQFFLYHR
jgi:pimeloyl-ACP methyl ester carboxylesterase